jgi:hypothetical protein
MKRPREAASMPPEYVKGPGKPGQLHPHWRKSFPDDEEDVDGRGKVVQVPDALLLYGEWRRVPGFWKILASDEGFIATEGEWRVRTPTVSATHYLNVHCNDKPEYVHLLVGRAFHGLPTPEQLSVDHIGGKELPMAERRANNRAANLKWATAAEQNRNQGERKAKSCGEPCLVWEVKGDKLKNKSNVYDMTPVVGAARRFPSLLAAATAFGLNSGGLSRIFNKTAKTLLGTDGKRYTGKWDPDLNDLDGEEWKEKPLVSRNRLLISNHGRLQFIYPGGRKGHKHNPESSNAEGYVEVQIDGEHKSVHVLVGELFFIGPKPRNWCIWDHKDLDKRNNHIGNLRPVTVEENNLNTARHRDFYVWPKDDPDDWVRCVSQRGTARAYNLNLGNLGNVLHKRDNGLGYFHKTVNGYCAAFCDEVDES